MIRPLLIVFVAGIAVAVVCGAVYSAIHVDRDPDERTARSGPIETREIAWTGADRLDVATMAEVTYTQGPAPKITVTGRATALDHVKIEGGRIRIDAGCVHSGNGDLDEGCIDIGDLKIDVVGTSTTAFDISGAGTLDIRNYDQPRLRIQLSGLGRIDVEGRTDALDLDLSGGGKADLDSLTVKDATVDLSGLGEARLGPTGVTRIDISGGGRVELLNHPSSLESHITGLGKIDQP